MDCRECGQPMQRGEEPNGDEAQWFECESCDRFQPADGYRFVRPIGGPVYCVPEEIAGGLWLPEGVRMECLSEV